MNVKIRIKSLMMDKKRFLYEINTLQDFMQLHCKNKHFEQKRKKYQLIFNDKSYQFNTFFCEECQNLFEKTTSNISKCPHLIKPKCRNCTTPCHDKTTWKKIAKIMRYSGIRLGLIKIKNLFKPL